MHTPAEFSWKQWWVKETFTHDDLFSCTDDEQQQFDKRLEECKITLCDNKKAKDGRVITFATMLDMITDPTRMNIKKQNRSMVYPSNNGVRPIGKTAFNIWGGFQVIDMDIDDRDTAIYFKKNLFKRLKKYNWFFGIAFSSSGKGLHIYTKIQVPESMGDDNLKRKILFLTNFRHKYSFVYLACLSIIEDNDKYTKESVLQWLDLSMFRPQQGAFLGYDMRPLINTHFFEDFIHVCFDNVEDMGHPNVDWVAHPDLKELFKRWEWFEDDSKEQESKIELLDAQDVNVDIHNKIHYKHFERWRLANTLVRIYGFEKGYKYLRMICDNKISNTELRADCKTAKDHEKNIDTWAVNRLNKYHGFNIKIKIDEEERSVEDLYDNVQNIENPLLMRSSPKNHNFYINRNQYLTDITDDILKSIGRVTLLEAGAGVGKTEMVKMLARTGKHIMLVMPFTSTIKSKIESESKNGEDDEVDWYWSYGNKRVRLDKQNISLTIDKFSKLNILEIKEAGYDYIFVDESHLLFQSEYRPVMPNVIEMITNSEVPIILMSGTPIGETVFFPDIVHIKVTKEETRKKSFEVFLTDTPTDNLFFMCDDMARDISTGKRILFPTNQGTIYKEQVAALVKYFLENKYFYFEPFVVNYYKKSNVGEKFMDDVNFRKTIDNTNLMMCTTYLSVGVDILDRYEFNIYFNDIWMPQEIEQFANRLRSHDLYCKLYINRKSADGTSLNVCGYRPCNFKLNDNEIKDAHSIVRLCNSMIERNPIESKYNSLVSSILQNNKYIKYNNVENKYYLAETPYKTTFFERKYRDYVQQLPVLIKGMESYGYEYSSRECGDFQFSAGTTCEEATQAMKDARASKRSLNNKYIEELLDLITDNRLVLYKDVMRGAYDIQKGNEWKEDTVNKIMKVKNIEVFERVIPLFLSMSKMYDVEDVKDIFEVCRTSTGNYNFSLIQRMRMLITIVYNEKLRRLDLPIKKYMESVYRFTEEHPEGVLKEEIFKFISDFANEYAAQASTETIKILMAPGTMRIINDTLLKIFRCMIDMGRPARTGTNKGIMKLERIDLPWVDKETKEIHKTSVEDHQLYFIGEFLDNLQIKTLDVDVNTILNN